MLSDTGEYQFGVSVVDTEGREETRNFTLTLEYLQEPSVSVGIAPYVPECTKCQEEEEEEDIASSSSSPFYLPHEEYLLNCSVQGYPVNTSSVEVTFAECSSYGECGEARPVEHDTLEPDDGNMGKVHYSYVAKTR